MVVAAARVSTSGEDALAYLDPSKAEESKGLINYLMKHRHSTPFEHAALTMFVHAPIFVWREWHRHRVMSYNEESGRYKQLDPVFWIPSPTRKILPVENFKPARPQFRAATLDEYNWLVTSMASDYQTIYDNYQEKLDRGYAKEVSRATLPVGIFSSCWVTCNPRALMAFLSLRTHNPEAIFVSYPQAEIEEAALQTEEILKTYWPITHEAFVKNGRCL